MNPTGPAVRPGNRAGLRGLRHFGRPARVLRRPAPPRVRPLRGGDSRRPPARRPRCSVRRRCPRARHLTCEHVPLADVLAGQVTISRVGARLRAAQGARAGRGRASSRAGRRSRGPRPTVRIASPSSDRGRDVPAGPVRSSGARLVVGVLVVVAVRRAASSSRSPWRRGLSKSVAKARIEPECRRRNVDIPRFFSRPIPARGAFATDLDNRPPRIAPGVPPAPPRRRPATANPDEGGGGLRGGAPGPTALDERARRLRPAGRSAWRDGVSHVVTPPPRDPSATPLHPLLRAFSSYSGG